MFFYPDAAERLPGYAQEIFSHGRKPSSNHSEIYFNNIPLKRKNTQKHLELFLNAKPNFSENINEEMKNTVKGPSVIKKLNITLPRSSLLTIYKSFITSFGL